MFGRIHSAWRGAAGDERGFTIPTVTLMLLAAMAIVTVGVTASLHAQTGATRDEQSKAAFQAAEAAVSQALLRYNSYFSNASPLTTANPCIGPTGNPAPTNGGWCPAVSASVSGGSATYYVQPSPATGILEIVAVGNVGGVTRRVDVQAKSPSGQQMFIDAGVKSQNDINLSSNAEIDSTVATGGAMNLQSNASQCGLASVGVGKAMTLAANARYYQNLDCTGQLSPSAVGHAPLTLPAVNQGDAAASNDNARITNAVNGSGSPADLISGKRSDVSWDPSTRQLTIDHNSSLTLTGTKYSFCKVTLQQNSAIYISAGLSTTIFFDSPESCRLPSGTIQLNLQSNSRITPAVGAAASLAMLFVGSTNLATSMVLNSNTSIPGACVQNFVIYAPLTDATLNSNSQYCGALAVKSLTMNSNARIQIDAASQAFVLPNTPPHYTVTRFVECTAGTASPPNAGC